MRLSWMPCRQVGLLLRFTDTHEVVGSTGGTAMLRSVKDLHYYGLHATDGNMGVVYSVN